MIPMIAVATVVAQVLHASEERKKALEAASPHERVLMPATGLNFP